MRRFLRADELCCQLFSEPGAGSDLAGLATRAERDGEEWIVNGQKVWSSGAQFSEWGELIARTDPDVPKHAGHDRLHGAHGLAGVEVRPTRQMSGGSSFNEVFLTDVRIPDTLRLGAVGAGWKVALTTLGFERGNEGGGGTVGGTWTRLLALARHLDKTSDPVVRQQLAGVYIPPAAPPAQLGPVLGGGRQRPAAGRRRVGLQADVGPGDDPDGRSGGGPARPPHHRRHR